VTEKFSLDHCEAYMWPTAVALIALLALIVWIRVREPEVAAVPRLVGTGKYAIEVVSESDCSSGLDRICRSRIDGGVDMMLRARLILESGDGFERQAIRVSIRGCTVGYLPRANARDFRRAATYTGLGRTLIFECAAIVRGSTDQYSVWLDLPNDCAI
jgi:hypothetical protein